jgi:hypothetical protein
VKETLEFLSLPPAVRQDIMKTPERFPFATLKILMKAFRLSKNHGKKLFAAIASGEVTTSTDAENYINKLQA